MTSPVISKDRLTAYQRWELSNFEDRDPSQQAEDEANALKASLPTAEQIEQIYQQARQEGHALGKEEGFKAGFEAGKCDAEAQVARLVALSDALDQEALRQDEEIAAELLSLALTLAKQMVRTTFRVKRDKIVEVVREALNSLPSLNGHLRVLVHPDDLDTVREFMGLEHGHMSVKVLGDARVEQGGFKLESNFSEVDGQLDVRWREIVACLGADDSWLE